MEVKAFGIKHDLLNIKQELPLKCHSFTILCNNLVNRTLTSEMKFKNPDNFTGKNTKTNC